MNYRKLERMLYDYISKKLSVQDLEVELSNLALPSGISGINYDEKITTGKISNQPEESYLRKEIKEEELKLKIKKIKNDISKIDNAMKYLDEVEVSIIKYRYFKGLQWHNIAFKVKYSESHCRRIRTKALYKMLKIINFI